LLEGEVDEGVAGDEEDEVEVTEDPVEELEFDEVVSLEGEVEEGVEEVEVEVAEDPVEELEFDEVVSPWPKYTTSN
jgi:hypothetical protein